MGRSGATTSSIDQYDPVANPTLARVVKESAAQPAYKEGKDYRVVCLEGGSMRRDLPIFASSPGVIRLDDSAKPPVTRHDAEGIEGGFVLKDVCTAEECDQMVRMSETFGFTEENELGLESPVLEEIDYTTKEDQLVIVACGHTLGVDMVRRCSVADVRSELQNTFHIDGQAFGIFDSSGAPVATDAQLQQAVEGGLTPLGASLPEEPCSNGEPNAQWKFLREQLQCATERIVSLEKQLNSLRKEMELHIRLVDGQPGVQGMGVVGEQVELLRDAYERLRADQAAHGQVHTAGLEELRAELSYEKRTREALEGQCAACTRALEEQLHAASAYHEDMLREHVEAFKSATYDGLQQLTQEVTAQLTAIEDRCAALESQPRADTAAEASSCTPVGFTESHEQQASVQERWVRDHQQRLARHAWVADQTRQINEIEKKLTERKESEAEPARPWAGVSNATPRGGHITSSPLRVRPQVSSVDLAGGSPVRARAPSVAPMDSGSSPLRMRFPMGSAIVSGGNSAGAVGCLGGGGLATPRSSPPATSVGATVQSRGRAVGIPCSATPGGAEARKQSFSPVRQMMLITQKSFGAGLGASSGAFTRS